MICEIWQLGNDPTHLLLVLPSDEGDHVVNGFYSLTDKLKKEMSAERKGLIDWPWINEYQNEDYGITLQRFQNGERAQFVVCSCCDVGSWRNEKGEKIKEPDPKDYPWNDND